MRLRKKLGIVFAILVVMALLVGCGPGSTVTPTEPSSEAPSGPDTTVTETPTEKPPLRKMAWICESSLTDGGWNENGFAAVNELATKHGFELSYQEDVKGTEVADVLRNYAASGYELVLSNEQYHAEEMAVIATEFPDVTFGCINGYVSAETGNMYAITGDNWQHIYLAGVMAGGVTESKKIGLITFSTDSDSALLMVAAWGSGARAYDPEVELIHVATGSFSDLAIGKEMAISLIDQGCDVIFCNSGDTNETVMDYCIEKGIYAVSAIVDRNDWSPDYVIGSAMLQPSDMLRVIIDGYVDGSLMPSTKVMVMGLKEGIEDFRINPDIKDKVDPAVFEKIDQIRADIIDGKIVKDDLYS